MPQINQIIRVHPNKRSISVGRGGKRGKTSGRGTKGQKARAGHKIYPQMRDVIKRIPKLRGRGKNIFQSFQERFIPVNLPELNKAFNDGDTVSPDTLLQKGLVRMYKGKNPLVKILGGEGLTKKLVIKNCRLSGTARAAIEKMGGTVPGPKVVVTKPETVKAPKAPKEPKVSTPAKPAPKAKK